MEEKEATIEEEKITAGDEKVIAAPKPSFNSLEEEVAYLRNENKRLMEEVSSLKCKSKQKSADAIKKETRRKKKEIDLFGVYKKRKIALKLAYVGINYHGLSRQENSKHTIENFLFEALNRTLLIEPSDQNLQYSRAGRTDKGVSAVGNVLGIVLRTNEPKEEPLQAKEEKKPKKGLDYVAMLNGNLPEDIKIIDYALPENEDFNARYQCLEREYRYFFFENGMNITAISEACKNFLGRHDFRNFCKIDLTNSIDYEKEVIEVRIEELNITCQPESDKRLIPYVFVVRGKSFLWHQIRCMIAILFMVGKGQESVDIVKELLDISKTPRKPNYSYADEKPLILYDCKFKNLNWVNDTQNSSNIYSAIQETLVQKYVEQYLFLTIINYIFNSSAKVTEFLELNVLNSWLYILFFYPMNKKEVETLPEKMEACTGSEILKTAVNKHAEKMKREHKKLMGRSKALSLEEAINNLTGKEKLIYEMKLEKKLKFEQEITD